MTAVLLDPLPRASPESLIGRDYISWSALSTFRSCPLKFHFRYVLGLPEDTVSSSLVFGGAIHAAIQHHYEELLAGNDSPDLDTLLAVYQDEWRERDEGAIRFGRNETIGSLGQLAERMLRAFSESAGSNTEGRVIGIEEELRGAIVPGCPDLLARIDLLFETEDAVVVRDFKTSRSRWSRGKLDDASEQLLLYHELASELVPSKPVRLQFVVITKGKEPVVETLEAHFDAARIKRTRRVVERVWQAIEAGHSWPNPSPMNCPSCPYREPCGAWRG